MYLPQDPYKGLSPAEALKRTWSRNNNVLKDVDELIEDLGGKDNIETLITFKVDEEEDRPDWNSSGLVFTEYELKVKDMKETLFQKEKTDFRGFGGVIFAEKTSKGRIVISATEPVERIMKDWLDYHSQEVLEVQKL